MYVSNLSLHASPFKTLQWNLSACSAHHYIVLFLLLEKHYVVLEVLLRQTKALAFET